MTSNSSTYFSSSLGSVSMTKHTSSTINSTSTSTSSLIVQIPQSALDMLLHIHSTMCGPHVTHATLLDNDAYIASNRPWVIDFGAFFHMTDIKNKFALLYFLEKHPPVNITDGSSATAVGDRITNLLTLNNVLFVPKFLSVCYILAKLPKIILVL